MSKAALFSQFALISVVSILSFQGTAGQGFSSSNFGRGFWQFLSPNRFFTVASSVATTTKSATRRTRPSINVKPLSPVNRRLVATTTVTVTTTPTHSFFFLVIGTPASVGQYPFVVFLEFDNGEDQCGGTLLSKSWVLTAAHCFDEGRFLTKILIGTHTKDGLVPNVTETRRMQQKCCHKDYNDFTKANDICLIKLSSPVTFGKYIQKANLPPAKSKVADGSSTVIMGWGLNEDFISPNDLQRGDVKVVNQKQCIDWYAQDGTFIPKEHFCAGGGLTDTCVGDSGGPLVVEENGKFTLRGVTSFGPRTGDCGVKDRPGVYVRVSSYVSWINEKMSRPCIERNWTPWKSLGCSVTCGEGTERRTRKCQDEDGKSVSGCLGRPNKVRACTRPSCKEYRWSPWKKTCMVTCGNGIEEQTRNCMDERNKVVSKSLCPIGQSKRKRSCRRKACTEKLVASPTVSEPIKYAWGPWTKHCSVTCGHGTELSSRRCLNDQGDSVTSLHCQPGSDIKRGKCSLPPCEKKNQWGPWKTTCSVTCGRGIQLRRRHCLTSTGKPLNSGNCQGNSLDKGVCVKSPCKFTPRYKWGKWRKRCSVTCGTGIENNFRQCLDDQGRTVTSSHCSPGSEYERRSCTLSPCMKRSGPFHWGQWRSWSICRVRSSASNACDGFRSTTRDCLNLGRDVAPYRCISTIGGDYYKEESCKPSWC